MNKALTWHIGSWGSNPDTTKVYSAPILLGTPPHALTHSLTMPVVMCSSVNTSYRRDKKEVIVVKILAAPFLGPNTDIIAMYGRKGAKK